MAVVDSYSESNQDSNEDLYNISRPYQSFNGDGGTLESVQYYCTIKGTDALNISATIYAHSGTYGTSSVGTGSALATSDSIAQSTLTVNSLFTLSFTGADKITLTNGTKYVVAVNDDGGGAANRSSIGVDKSSPTHGGNSGTEGFGTWTAQSGWDLAFYVNNDTAAPLYKSTPISSTITADGADEEVIMESDE